MINLTGAAQTNRGIFFRRTMPRPRLPLIGERSLECRRRLLVGWLVVGSYLGALQKKTQTRAKFTDLFFMQIDDSPPKRVVNKNRRVFTRKSLREQQSRWCLSGLFIIACVCCFVIFFVNLCFGAYWVVVTFFLFVLN